MSPFIILHQATKRILVAYSERELTFEVNLPTNLGELTFKNMSKWVIDHSRVEGYDISQDVTGYEVLITCGILRTTFSFSGGGTKGPMWGYPRPVLGAVDPFLEPFCGYLSLKVDEIFRK